MAYQRLADSVLPDQSSEHSVRIESRELFDEAAAQQRPEEGERPWWAANFFVRSPTLFGTWDGVFTTVMLNIFGVLIFLRMGWVVGFAGVGLTMLIIFITVLVGAITVMSIIGLITRHVEHTRMQQTSADDTLAAYDVFAMIGFVLGERISGAAGLVYAFGHAVGVALYAVGLGEAMSDLFHWSGPWPIRGVALATAFILLLVVLAGVRWVIKLQLVLIVVLAIATLDFVLGTLTRHSPENGVLGYSSALLHNNTNPAFTSHVSFYKVFGVFFPTVTGVAGGLNMACDLKTPSRSVPVGSTTALGVSTVSWIVMTIMLGATCTKDSLQTDTLIEYRVSAVGALFLIGLYVSSLSSCLAVFYGAPRVLQSMGRAKIVPILSFIGRGRGPNQEPFVAILVVGAIGFVFIFIGHLNTLAIVISMPFLLTYCILNYAYFSLSMSDDRIACIRKPNRQRLGSLYRRYPSEPDLEKFPADEDGAEKKTRDTPPPRLLKTGKMTSESMDGATKRRSSPPRDESDLLLEKKPATGQARDSVAQPTDTGEGRTEKWLSGITSHPRLRHILETLHLSPAHRRRYEDRYLAFLNRLVSRWLSLLGSLLCFVVMFVIHWGFALAAVCSVLILYISIGHANPSLSQGESSFSLAIWIQELFRRLHTKLSPPASASPPIPKPGEQTVILPEPTVPFDYTVVQLTQENNDYRQRERVHHSVWQTQLAPEFSVAPARHDSVSSSGSASSNLPASRQD